MRAIIIILAIGAAIPAAAQIPCPARVEPDSVAGIIYTGGDHYELRDGLLLMPGYRGPGYWGYCSVAEFAVFDFKEYSRISLVFDSWNYDPGGAIGTIRLYTFIGDGVVTITDYYAGDIYATMPSDDGTGDRIQIVFDVLPVFESMFLSGSDYVGFQLSSNYDIYEVWDIHLCMDDGTPIEALSWGRIKGLYR
jgi:hypothetical protein